jgi:hypothetical protein
MPVLLSSSFLRCCLNGVVLFSSLNYLFNAGEWLKCFTY